MSKKFKDLQESDKNLQKLLSQKEAQLKKKNPKEAGAVLVQFENYKAKEIFESQLKKNKENAKINGAKKILYTTPGNPVDLNWSMYTPGAKEPKCKRCILWIIIFILIFVRKKIFPKKIFSSYWSDLRNSAILQ